MQSKPASIAFAFLLLTGPILLLTPSAEASVALPPIEEWTTDQVLSSNIWTAISRQYDGALAMAGYNSATGGLELKVGGPTSFNSATVNNAAGGHPCIFPGATGAEWYVVYRDTTTQTPQIRSTVDTGQTWSSASQVYAIAKTQFACVGQKDSQGNIAVVLTHGSTNSIDVEWYRSTNNGASFTAKGIIDTAAYAIHYIFPITKYGDDFQFHFRDASTGNYDRELYRIDNAFDDIELRQSLNLGGLTNLDCGGPIILDNNRWVTLQYTSGTTLRLGYSTNGGTSWTYTTVWTTDGPAYCQIYGEAGTDGDAAFWAIRDQFTDTYNVVATDDGGLTLKTVAIGTGSDWDGVSYYHTYAIDGFLVNLYGPETGGLNLAYGQYGESTGGSTGTTVGSTGSDPTGGGSRTYMTDVNPTATWDDTIVDLLAFDVDESGTNLLVRAQYPGQIGFDAQIYSRDAGSLNALGNRSVGDCSLIDAVVAGQENLGFKDCSGNAPIFRVTSRALGEPTRPADCNDDACKDEYSNLDGGLDLPNLDDLDWIEGFTVDYDGLDTTQRDNNILGMAYTAINEDQGNSRDVGVFGYFALNNGDDEGEIEILSTAFTPSSTKAVGLCSWINDLTGDRHVAAATSTTVRAWELFFDGDPTPNANGFLINDLEIDNQPGVIIPGSGNQGIACWGQTLWLTTSDAIYAYNLYSGSLQWSDASEGYDDTPAVSGNGEILAVFNDTSILILDAEGNGVNGRKVLADLNYPPGFNAGDKEIHLSFKGGTLWLASDSGIYQYNIEAATCVWDCSYTGSGIDSDGDGIIDIVGGQATAPNTGNVADQPVGPFRSLIDRLSVEVKLGLGLAFLVAILIFGYKIAGPAPMIAGTLLAVGLVVNTVILAWPVWILISIAAVSSIASLVTWFSKRVAA